MSDPENFIARWSRRKRQAAEDAADDAAVRDSGAIHSVGSPPPCGEGLGVGVGDADASRATTTTPLPQVGREQAESAARNAATSTRGAATSMSGAPPFDPTTLPPIEAITATTDIRAFLAPGVPPELTRAALRRAWTADPKIRDFVGLAENAWDFNAPNAIAGFGPLDMPEELRQRLIDMVGGGPTPTPNVPDISPAPTAAPRPVARLTVEESTESAGGPGAAPMQLAQADFGRQQVDAPKDASDESEEYNSGAVRRYETEHIAVQNNPAKPDNDQTIVKRPHGRALPE